MVRGRSHSPWAATRAWTRRTALAATVAFAMRDLRLGSADTTEPPPRSKSASTFLQIVGDDAWAPSLRSSDPLALGARALAVPSGWFVPVLGGSEGYAVIDEAGGPPMATIVADYGGLETLGPPVSRPCVSTDGWTLQVFARVIVGWRDPDFASGVLLSAPDLLRQAGIDTLIAAAGVPIAAPPPVGPEDSWRRLAWMTDPAMRAAYLAPTPPFVATPSDHGIECGEESSTCSDPTEAPLPDDSATPSHSARRSTPTDLAALLGPPTSLPITTGAYRRQRFERGITEVEVDASPDVPPTIVPLGLLLRRAAAMPPDALRPDMIVGNVITVRGRLAVVPWQVSTTANDLRPANATPMRNNTSGSEASVPPTREAPVPTTGEASVRRTTATPAPISVSAAATSAPRSPGALVRVRAVTATGGLEQVILANDGTASQDLGGWFLRSGTSSTRHALPVGFRIDSGATVALLSGRDAPASPPAGAFTLGRRSLWRDDGGAVVLFDREGQEVDRRSYP